MSAGTLATLALLWLLTLAVSGMVGYYPGKDTE